MQINKLSDNKKICITKTRCRNAKRSVDVFVILNSYSDMKNSLFMQKCWWMRFFYFVFFLISFSSLVSCKNQLDHIIDENCRSKEATVNKVNSILIDSFKYYVLQIQQTNLLLKCADFFFAITFRQYSISVCLFLLKNWRESNILMIVSILFTIFTQKAE